MEKVELNKELFEQLLEKTGLDREGNTQTCENNGRRPDNNT